MKKGASGTALGLCALALTGSAAAGARPAGGASTPGLTATMTSQEVVTVKGAPAKVSKALSSASGAFAGTISSDKKALAWKISYAKLGKPHLVAADIHIGKAGQWGAILVRLCAPCTSGQSGTAKLKSGYAQRLLDRPHWITLITDAYPNGVVRGQIKTH